MAVGAQGTGIDKAQTAPCRLCDIACHIHTHRCIHTYTQMHTHTYTIAYTHIHKCIHTNANSVPPSLRLELFSGAPGTRMAIRRCRLCALAHHITHTYTNADLFSTLTAPWLFSGAPGTGMARRRGRHGARHRAPCWQGDPVTGWGCGPCSCALHCGHGRHHGVVSVTQRSVARAGGVACVWASREFGQVVWA